MAFFGRCFGCYDVVYLMNFRSFAALLSVGCALSQTPPEKSNTPQNQDRVIATVNGQDMTARQFEALLTTLPPDVRKAAEANVHGFLQQHAFADLLRQEAEKSKIGERSPYREYIAESRRQLLIKALVEEKSKALGVNDELIRKTYDENKTRYSEARVRVIFISGVQTISTLDGNVEKRRSPEEAKKLTDQVYAKLRAGANFAELAKEHSDDATSLDKGGAIADPVRPTSAAYPVEVRDALLAAKPGDLLGPYEHTTGYYIFSVDSVSVQPFEQVRDRIRRELSDAALGPWMNEIRAKVAVSMKDTPSDANALAPKP